MRNMKLYALILVLAFVAGTSTVVLSREANHGIEKGWICPPCGHEEVDKVYEEAGSCPICSMELITTEERARIDAATVKVAILLFDGVQIIDFTGPYEVFGQARFEVFTVSQTGDPIVTTMGMHVDPDYSIGESPQPDILLVPGGNVHGPLDSGAVLEWVTTSSARSDYVLSVCNGAFILAKAGLLDGLEATTFYGMLDDLEESYPKVQVVRDQRYTDNGKILTSAGLSAGIDASIYLVSKLKDEEAARSLALHLEYGWDPDSGFVRGELADRHLPDVDLDLPEGTKIETLSSLGDGDRWVLRLGATTDLAADDLLGIFESSMKEFSHWQQVDSSGTADEARARWNVSTESDGLWSASAEVAPTDPETGYLVTVRVERQAKS